MIMKRYLIHILSCMTIGLLICLSSCKDELLYDPAKIGEGEGTISFDMRFESMIPALEETRTSGTAIKKIENVSVVVYNNKGELYKIYRSQDDELRNFAVYSTNNNVAPDRPSGTVTTETGTDVASFTLENIPFGIYYFYVVANLDITDEEASTPESLKDIVVPWEQDWTPTDSQSEKYLSNKAMFGYFRANDSEATLGFEAPPITVNKTQTTLSAWVRRLASKLTLAFDPSGLNESVFIYIKSATIHHIPKACYLGKDNTPSQTELYQDGESIKYYTSEGNIDTWLELDKSSGIQGNKDHLDTDNALFFFENMQGDYEGQKAYYKPQIKGETGTSINTPTLDAEGNIINDYKDRVPAGTYIEVEAYYNSQNPEQLSSGPIKYRFMLGQNTTYNYDVIRNHHYKLTLKFKGWANEPDWHIVYEEPEPTIFVPQKYYISYLYNQSMEMPVRILGLDETARENYYLHSEIIENNWAPYDPSADDGLPPTEKPMGAYQDINGFAWYRAAYESNYLQYNTSAPVNYVGFLSVRQNNETIVGNSIEYGAEANAQLENYYYGREATFGSQVLHVNPRDEACYFLNQLDTSIDITAFPGTQTDQDDGSYSVSVKDDGSTVVTVPFYTRAKELVSQSDFSGNNVFYAYQRKAVVRFTLREKGPGGPSKGDKIIPFKIRDLDGTIIENVSYKDVPIYQVRRIVNPKAIWRAYNSTESFYVQLMHLEDAGSDTYTTFESEGKWRVSVVQDPKDLIRINGKKLREGEYIEGSTGTPIEFTYAPSSTIGVSENRGGIIKVEYHDYSCNHLIFVNQGYDAPVTLGGVDWSCYNAIAAQGQANANSDLPEILSSTNVVVTNSPLSIGSFFKRCQYNWAILEENNRDYGWLESISTADLKTATITDASLNTDQKYIERTIRWASFWGYRWQKMSNQVDPATGDQRSWADTWTAVNKNNTILSIPSLEDYRALRDDQNCEYGYGIVYGDGANSMQTNRDDAGGFFDYNNDGKNDELALDGTNNKGMRACIVYDKTNGNQTMFPLGAQGQGRRTRAISWGSIFSDAGPGSLTYSGGNGLLQGNRNIYRPLVYNLYRSPGAIYWFKMPGLKDYSPDLYKDIASWDINYYTLVFNPYAYNSLYTGSSPSASNSSDALPIKLIYKKQ